MACQKCGYNEREITKFCPKCGYSRDSVFRTPKSKFEALKPALASFVWLLSVNLLFLIAKVIPQRYHLSLEIVVYLLFVLVIGFYVYPFRSRISFLSKQFFNKTYSIANMFGIALPSGVLIWFYFAFIQLLGYPTEALLKPEDVGTLVLPWVVLSTVLLAPVAEEIYFRGYLYQKFRLILKPQEVIILQGLLFGIIHLNPITYLSHALIGIVLGYIRYRTNSLVPCVLLHAMWNFFVVFSQYFRLENI